MHPLESLQKRMNVIRQESSLREVQKISGVAYDIVHRVASKGADTDLYVRNYVRIERAVSEIEKRLGIES